MVIINNINLNNCEKSSLETTITINVGNTAPMLYGNTDSIIWVDGQVPTLEANKNYLIVIYNCLAFVKEY